MKKNKRVFIDANIYLNFFRKPDYPVSQLDKLLALEDFEIIVTKQVVDEFYRNIENVKDGTCRKILNYKKKFDGNIDLPILISSKEIKKVINKNRKLIKENLDKVASEYKAETNDLKSEVNKAIKNIFSKVEGDGSEESMLQKAYFRTLQGNPPRKGNKSFGDAINWEIILSKYSDLDITIISGDGDFSSNVDSNKLNEFLEHEWVSISKFKISFFTTLGEFLNTAYKKEVVAEKEIEDELVLNKSYINDNLIFSSNLNSAPVLNSNLVSLPSINPGLSFLNQDGYLKIESSNSNLTTKLNNCSRCDSLYIFTQTVLMSDLCPSCRRMPMAFLETKV